MDRPITFVRRIAPGLWKLAPLLFILTACDNPITALKPDASSKPTPANNSAPSISGIADVTTAQDQSVTVAFKISDPDGPLDCMKSVYVVPSDSGLLPGNQIFRGGTAPNCTLTFQPAQGYWGSSSVQVQAYDGKYTAATSFNLTVTQGTAVPTVSSATAPEGSVAVFTLRLSHALPGAKTFSYATADGTAVAGVNYTSTSGSVTFAAGETVKTVSVPTIDDGVAGPNLTFALNVTAIGVSVSGTGTVINIDGPPTASAANVSGNEGTALTFTVTLSHGSTSPTTVTYTTANGTAVSGTNYTAASGTLTFSPGQTTKTISISTIDDGAYGTALTFSLQITANSVTNTATGTIQNIEGPPTASAANVSVNEGASLTFTVNLSQPSTSPLTVAYGTNDGTALAGRNYTSAAGSLNFAPGETSKIVTVASQSDGVYTANLTFTLSLTVNAVTNNATGTIVNTDGAPTASAADVTANEGSNLVFTVTLNHASSSSTTVTYATSDGTAVAGTNYASSSGTLTFAAGQTSKTVTVASLSDNVYSPDLAFTLSLTANSTTNTATGTVANTDTAPGVSVSSTSATEGTSLTFSVSLSRASAGSTSVAYATGDGSAIAGTNYTAASGTLTFAAGETSKTITVTSLNDSVYGPDLTFKLNATLNSVTVFGTGTVVNSDAAPTVAVSAVSANEGSNLTFTLTLSHAAGVAIPVSYATADATAKAGTNYTAASGTLTFAAGQTSKTVVVTSLADSIYTPDLTFSLNATANSATSTGVGTVLNTDAAPTASAADVAANEGTSLVFTVNLSRASTTSTTVTYSTSDGTAAAGTNYAATSGTLTFAAGQTSKTVTVPSFVDNVYTAGLTFTLSLTANSTTNTATGTVGNTDAAPLVSVSSAFANEGSGLTFTVSLNRASSTSIAVAYATADGTAVAGTNYTAASGTLTFNAGQTSKTVTVTSLADSLYGPDLTFKLNATLNSVTSFGTGTVVNTDSPPTVSVNTASANEGAGLTFTVTLSHATAAAFPVTYATADVTAKASVNYTAASGTLTFTAGQTSKTVTIASLADSTYAPNLTFSLNVTSNSVLSSGVGTVVNTDTLPTVSVSTAVSSVVEGQGAVFNFTLNHASAYAVQVSYATVDGTATAASGDYAASSGTATIAAGALSTSMTVVTYDDNADEQDETFSVQVSAAQNANLGTASATETITDTTLYYDFTAGNLPSDVTFARASAASYFDSSGTLQTAASGAARFDYDPSSCSGTCAMRGLLIEEARTNLLLQSSSFAVTWVNSGTTITSNSQASPSGAVDADTIQSTAGGNANTNKVSQSVTLAASTPYTLSFFVKNSNSLKTIYEVSALNSGITGKSITLSWAGGVPTASAGVVTALPNGWYRVNISFVTNASDGGVAAVNFYPSTTLHNGAVYAWGAQLEAGDTRTSYIATTTATVTRAADSLTVGNFATWFNATTWTAILDFSRPLYEAPSSAASPVMFSACDDTSGAACAANFFEATYIPADNTFRGRADVSSSNVATSNYTNAASLDGVKVQMAVSQSSGGALQTVVNGTSATASSVASIPTTHLFNIGASGVAGSQSRQLNGHLKKFTYRTRALTTAQMRAMTSD